MLVATAMNAVSRYQTTVGGEAHASVAKWSFKVLDGITETTDVIDFAITRTDGHTEIPENKLAPGTYGQMEIEIDARGTETILRYIIDVTLENAPRNMKFYSDSAKTRELPVVNNVFTEIGYMSLIEVNEIKTETIYWDWPYETGENKTEIGSNDIEDTQDAGKQITMQISVTGEQVLEIEEEPAQYFNEESEITIPFTIPKTDAATLQVASITPIRIGETDPLGLALTDIKIQVGGNEIASGVKQLNYLGEENDNLKYELVVTGIQENGEIELVITKNEVSKIVETNFIMDNIKPTIQVVPEYKEVDDETNVTITITDNNELKLAGLEYYISSSNESITDGKLKTYENGVAFELEDIGTKVEYLWIKTIKDIAGNEIEYDKTIDGQNYVVKGPYKFEEVIEEMAGSGTEEDPYIIMQPAHLAAVTNNLAAHYQLGDNINLSKYDNWTPLGDSTTPFSGSLDGKGYTISNLSISTSTSNYTGLFGYNSGTIKNVTLQQVNVTGQKHTGVLVGYSTGTIENVKVIKGIVDGTGSYSVTCTGGIAGKQTGSITNCSVAVNVQGMQKVGGLIGENTGTVTKCYTTGTVTGTNSKVGGLIGCITAGTVDKCYTTGTVTGKTGNVGGLIGTIEGIATIQNSYATGTVTGKSYYTGGLIGYNGNKTASIINSYAIGTVTGTSDVGGLIGGGVTPKVTKSYYAKDSTGQTTSKGGTPKTIAEMLTQETFEEWEFIDIWTIEENTTTPYLRDMPIPDSVYITTE